MDMSLLQTKMKPATPLPELQTVEDIYRWIDENIAYGWQDKDGGTHTSEMKDFRRLYRTMSVTETLRQKIGTCIEQVALMHELQSASRTRCTAVGYLSRMITEIWRKRSICTAFFCISKMEKHITWSIRM